MTFLMIGNEQDSFFEMIEVTKTKYNSFADLVFQIEQICDIIFVRHFFFTSMAFLCLTIV